MEGVRKDGVTEEGRSWILSLLERAADLTSEEGIEYETLGKWA